MLELLFSKLEVAGILFALVFLVYWVMEWIKLVLKDKLKEVWVQPIALCIGTLIMSFVMYVYGYRAIDLGVAKYVWVDYAMQGALLTGVTGFIYDKYLDKELQTGKLQEGERIIMRGIK